MGGLPTGGGSIPNPGVGTLPPAPALGRHTFLREKTLGADWAIWAFQVYRSQLQLRLPKFGVPNSECTTLRCGGYRTNKKNASNNGALGLAQPQDISTLGLNNLKISQNEFSFPVGE